MGGQFRKLAKEHVLSLQFLRLVQVAKKTIKLYELKTMACQYAWTSICAVWRRLCYTHRLMCEGKFWSLLSCNGPILGNQREEAATLSLAAQHAPRIRMFHLGFWWSSSVLLGQQRRSRKRPYFWNRHMPTSKSDSEFPSTLIHTSASKDLTFKQIIRTSVQHHHGVNVPTH